MTRYALTPDLQQHIVASIRSGCYAHVAAEAWGLPQRVFARWLRLGRRPDAPYFAFAAEVRCALAQARLRAEITVFEDDARNWLEHGPGREMPGNPGWTGTVKPPELTPAADSNPLLNRQLMQTCAALLEALTPFPEARACAAQALAERHHPQSPLRRAS